MKLICTIILSFVILTATDQIVNALSSVCPEPQGINFIES